MPLSMWKGSSMVGLQSWQGASLWLVLKRVQENLLKFTMKQNKILSRDSQPLVTEARILKKRLQTKVGGLYEVCGFCPQRNWSHFKPHGRAWGRGAAGWSIPSGLMQQQLWEGTSGPRATEQTERSPPGSLARLGLAWWLGKRQCFGELPIVYVITGMLNQLIIHLKKKKSVFPSNAKKPKPELR